MFKIVSPKKASLVKNIFVNNLITFDSRQWNGEIQGGDYYMRVIIVNTPFDAFDMPFLDSIGLSVVKIGISEDLYSLPFSVNAVLTSSNSRVGIFDVAEFFGWIYDPDDILV